MPSYREQIGRGLAQYLAEHGGLTWDPAYGYPVGTAWPAYVQQDAPPTPHQMVHIAVGTQQIIRADYLTMIQIRVRGGIDAPDDVAEDQLQLLDDILYPNGFPLAHVQMGAVRVGLVAPVNMTPLPRDGQRRLSLVRNYRLRTRRPSPSSTPVTPPAGGSLYGAGLYGEGIFG